MHSQPPPPHPLGAPGAQDALWRPIAPAARLGDVAIRVRYSECDPMGVAHHGSYPAWLEISRTELLRPTGISYAAMERVGFFLVISRIEIKYRRPIYYDDLIRVRSRVVGGSRVKLEHEYQIVIAEDGGHGVSSGDPLQGEAPDSRPRRPLGEVVTTGATTLVCIGRDGRPQPLPDWLTL